MRHIDVLKIDINQIRMFLEVAAYGGITPAAEYLHVTKSMLSKNISAFEKELGLILFVRQNGRIKLTRSGKSLQKDFENISELIEKAIIKAHEEQVAKANPLIVGIPEQSNHGNLIRSILEEYQEFNSSFSYYTDSLPINELAKKVWSGVVDIMIAPLYTSKICQNLGVEYSVLEHFPLIASMTPDNPLNKKDILTPEDLMQQKFIIVSPTVLPDYIDSCVIPMCQKAGFEPIIGLYVSSPESLLHNVRHNDEIFIADSLYRIEENQNVRPHIIEGTESGIIIAWRKKPSPIIIDILNFIEENFQGNGTSLRI